MNRKVGVALLVLGAFAPSLLAAEAPPDAAEREVLELPYSEREVRVRGNTAVVREEGRWRLLAQSSTPIRGFGAAPRPTVAQAPPDAASPADTSAVEREVREALLAEQRAFLAGDRETVQTFLSTGPFPFVVDGCMRGDEDALPPCGSMFENPGKRPRRTTERHDVYVLGPNAAYTITHYANQITRPDETITRYPSVVTKIWARQGDGWRIVHLHESVAQPPSP